MHHYFPIFLTTKSLLIFYDFFVKILSCFIIMMSYASPLAELQTQTDISEQEQSEFTDENLSNLTEKLRELEKLVQVLKREKEEALKVVYIFLILRRGVLKIITSCYFCLLLTILVKPKSCLIPSYIFTSKFQFHFVVDDEKKTHHWGKITSDFGRVVL